MLRILRFYQLRESCTLQESYDSEQGGADFVLQILNNKQIIIEVGMGDKDKKQIINSMKKIDSGYNLIFYSSGLQIDKEFKTVSVPLEYYFLM